MPTAIIHIQNEDPVLGDLETMPAPTDLVVIVKNPRKRDGKDIHYLDPRVTLVVFPMARINFIEILPSGDEEEIITFVRE
jgi:hypothetical protein